MQYICLIYLDERRLAALPDSELRALQAQSARCEADWRAEGLLVAAEALGSVELATTLCNEWRNEWRNDPQRVSVRHGPGACTPEQLAGIVIIDAQDLDAALRLAAALPVRQLGSVEVRPLLPASRLGVPCPAAELSMTQDSVAPR
ncbi:MAG: YciI family protein [Alcanivorax sp.]|nr:YciI family protein [Alcanivorax sp.]